MLLDALVMTAAGHGTEGGAGLLDNVLHENGGWTLAPGPSVGGWCCCSRAAGRLT